MIILLRKKKIGVYIYKLAHVDYKLGLVGLQFLRSETEFTTSQKNNS